MKPWTSPGCIFCGKRIMPWQKARSAPSKLTATGRIQCHASCYDKRLKP